LHGYALNFLKSKGYKLFPKLPEVIREDAQILTEKNIDFKSLFLDEPMDKEQHEFYVKRRGYYGNFYGFADIIHALVEYFRSPENREEIPTYEQIVVDEFQDFNGFEVQLIELLATKSPILIVGDDDQSLYIDLKKASPAHIRKKHGKTEPDYIPFPLSYCSRSTEVIVEGINDFISSAVQQGLLKDRVEKIFKYFPTEKMDEEGEKHSKIIFRPVYSQFLTDYFRKELSTIAKQERKAFDVLIIIPNAMKRVRFPQIIKSLQIAGFRNVLYADKGDSVPSIIDGLSLMEEDPETNLGWRIALKTILPNEEFRAIVKRTQVEPDRNISRLVSPEDASKVRALFGSFQKLLKDDNLEDRELAELLTVAGYEPQQIAKGKMRDDFYSSRPVSSSTRGIKDTKIHVTTILGSKGLAADYVFLMDFSDAHFSRKKRVSDQNIYDFLVAMTRARKQIYLISPDDREATFVSWIKKSRIDRQRPFLPKKFN
jgi:superfamily I DNA/RNA helicase